jgi:hypothetical protein
LTAIDAIFTTIDVTLTAIDAILTAIDITYLREKQPSLYFKTWHLPTYTMAYPPCKAGKAIPWY